MSNRRRLPTLHLTGRNFSSLTLTERFLHLSFFLAHLSADTLRQSFPFVHCLNPQALYLLKQTQAQLWGQNEGLSSESWTVKHSNSRPYDNHFRLTRAIRKSRTVV